MITMHPLKHDNRARQKTMLTADVIFSDLQFSFFKNDKLVEVFVANDLDLDILENYIRSVKMSRSKK